MSELIYNVAMYLRLSRDDEDIDGSKKSESNSIGSQRDLIRRFIRENADMALYDVYIDDGYTGSNFERPEFKRMIEDVETKKVNCVIVKDLSRFGRDYIEAGRFIQKTFPALSVRFIAITDNYDSLTADKSESSIVLPVKNFINDSYCRDISMKVKSQQKIKRMKGEFIAPFAVYGYLKNPENKNQLIVDDYAADVVKKIYTYKIEGMSAHSIATKLNELGILSPMEYKKFIGSNYTTGFAGSAKTKWSPVAIKRILTNEVYTGVMVQGKKEKVNYKVKKYIEKPKNEWVRVKNTHEAIINKDEFDTVTQLLKADGRMSVRTGTNNLFMGLLFCGDCKEQMIKRVNKYKDTERTYFICSTKNRGEGCTRHSIEESELEIIVFSTVKKYVNAYIEKAEIFERAMQLEPNFEIVGKYDKQVKKIKDDQDKYTLLLAGLNEDFRNGIISKRDFDKLHDMYEQIFINLEDALHKQEDLIKQMFSNGIASGVRLKTFQQSLILEELDRRTLVSLVKKIYVYENKRIEIEFNFINEFEIMSGVKDLADENAIEGGVLRA